MSIFSKNKRTKLRTNTFNLSHDRKFSGKMGKLIPIFVADMIPGDSFTVRPNIFVRFAPLIAPVMHEVKAYVHYFFVPNRILFKNWERFITSGEQGIDRVVAPYVDIDFGLAGGEFPLTGKSSLSDYLGLPVGSSHLPSAVRSVSAFPFAAYQKIYDEYYRDQNLIDPVFIGDLEDGLVDGNNSMYFGALGLLRNRAWQHDYLTSALPFTQRGPAAMLPLGERANIVFDENTQNRQWAYLAGVPGKPIVPFSDLRVPNPSSPNEGRLSGISGDSERSINIDLNETHYADLSTATAATIEELRRAIKLQEYLEKMARGGGRYTEYLTTIFGVSVQDYRLQRPEYVGGYSVPVKISEVLQNAPATDQVQTPQGNMAGHGVSIGSGKINCYAPEHGYLIGIMSIMPRTAYQDGIPRHFLRTDKFEYFTPDFQHIGEQPIYHQEVYQGTVDPYEVFGYIPRYSEYKYIPSSVHGDFRDTLDFWHLGRKFDSDVFLNQDFIEMDDREIDRIFAVQDGSDHLWCHVYNDVRAKRPMSYFGNPKIM